MYNLLCSDSVKPKVQVDCLCVPQDGQFPHGHFHVSTGHFHVSTVNKDNDANVDIVTLCSFAAVGQNLLKITLHAATLRSLLFQSTTTACSLLARASPGRADQRMDYATCQREPYPATLRAKPQMPVCSGTPKIELGDKYRRV